MAATTQNSVPKSLRKKPAKQAVGTKSRHPHASPRSGVVPPPKYRFKPGESGNPKGRPAAGLSIIERINLMAEWSRKRVLGVANDAKAPMSWRIAARRLLEAAKVGGGWDFDRICDRTHGKPVQGITHSGDEGGPINLIVHTAGEQGE